MRASAEHGLHGLLLVLAVAVVTAGPIASAATPALLLFGGKDHNTFLGCLNCSRLDSGSVCNRFGDFGSQFSDASIWNQFGDYGSRFADTSPWNRLASEPPVVVDKDGSFYGYFTANRFHDRRTNNKFFRTFLDNADEVNGNLQRARDMFCGD